MRFDTEELEVPRELRHCSPPRLVLACIALGTVVALAALLVAAFDRARERRSQATSLLMLGARRGVSVALLGSVVGWLSGGATYVTMGGCHGWFRSGVVAAAPITLAATLLTALVTLVVSSLGFREVDPELIRRE